MSFSDKVYLGIGANEGDAYKTLQSVILYLDDILHDCRHSSLYVTTPLGYVEQQDFINCVVSGYYDGTPKQLLELIHSIEVRFGRVRTIKNGPRTLDIDILLFGRMCVSQKNLEIPHPRITSRKFVLIPLIELDWALRDPVTEQPYSDLLSNMEVQGIYYMDLKRYSANL